MFESELTSGLCTIRNLSLLSISCDSHTVTQSVFAVIQRLRSQAAGYQRELKGPHICVNRTVSSSYLRSLSGQLFLSDRLSHSLPSFPLSSLPSVLLPQPPYYWHHQTWLTSDLSTTATSLWLPGLMFLLWTHAIKSFPIIKF